MNSIRVVLLVIGGLVAIALASLLAAVWLLHEGVEVAAVAIIAGFGTTALGGLVGVLANTRSQPDPVVQQAVHDAHAAGVGVGVEAGKAEVIEALSDPAVQDAAKKAGR